MFLMGSMLLGLAAVGIPVVIHLLHRRRTTPVRWGAMQFLVESKLRTKRRKRVDHWLLLLLRMAVVALLVLALARPLLVRGTYNPLSSGLATDVAVVLDRSLSTGREVGGQTAYERGVDAVAELARNMRPNDTLTVVLAEHRPQAQSVRLAPAKAADAARKLRELGPGQSDATIPEAVHTARELIGEGRNPRKLVLVVSDEQRSNWAIENHAAWQLATGQSAAGGGGKAAGRGVTVYALGVGAAAGAKAGADVAVADVSLSPSLIGVGRPTQIAATVSNAGAEAAGPVTVRLLVDGTPVDGRPVATLPAGESRTVQFEHAFAEAGSHWLKVQVDVADGLDADDAAVVAANVWQRLPVLVIDGQLSAAGDYRSSQFLLAAMQPVADPSQDHATLVQPKVVHVSAAAGEPLDGYAVVIVNDAPRLPAGLLTRLADHAKSGRGVWFILGPRTDESFVARDLGDAGLFAAGSVRRHEPGGAGPAAASASAEAGAASPGIDVRDPRHPTVQLVTAAERNTLTGAVTRGWWSLVPQGGDARVVLATQGGGGGGGDPLVIERPVGGNGGRVVVWCTSVDARWNNWPVMPNFVPLVNETLYHLASGPARGLGNRRLNAGQEIVWAGAGSPAVQRVTLTRPDGRQVELAPSAGNGRDVLSYNDTFVPGLYTLRFDRTEVPQPVYYGVGIDRRELDTATLAAADQKWLTDRGFLERRLEGPAELGAAVGAVNKGDDLWPLLAAALLASLLSETLMTWRMVRHQGRVEVAAAAGAGAAAGGLPGGPTG